jgi:two-component sensor histidine kinase
MNARRFHLEVPFQEHWRNVEVLRSSIQNLMNTIFMNTALCVTLGMIVAELIENALKYGDWSHPSPRSVFRLDLSGNDDSIQIRVQSPVSDKNPLDPLLTVVKELKSASSYDQVYCNRLRDVANTPANSSGLGLARIVAESRCAIDVVEKPEGLVEVVAHLSTAS